MNQESPNTFFSIKESFKQNDIFSILTGIYIFTWFTQLSKRIAFFDSIRFEFLLGSILFAFALFNYQKALQRYKGSGLGKICVTLVIYYLLFVALSVDPSYSWNVFFDRVFKFSLVGLFIFVFADNLHKLAFVLGCYFLAALKAGQEGLLGWLTGNLVWQNQGVMKLHGSIDMYGHPNSFSGFAVCLLPFIYCLYPIVNKYVKAALIFLSICATVIILFTGSRTGYVATSVFIIYACLTSLRKSFVKFALIIVPLICLGIANIPDQYKGRFESIFTHKEAEGRSTEARLEIMADAVQVFEAHPFGVGLGTFPKVRESMFGRKQNTHNLYLEVLTNTGFIGLTIFLLFIYKIMKVNRETIAMNRGKETYQAKFLTAVASAVIGYMWGRIFLGFFGMDMYEIYWWWATGLTLACYKISQIEAPNKY